MSLYFSEVFPRCLREGAIPFRPAGGKWFYEAAYRICQVDKYTFGGFTDSPLAVK
jgi:hypothetical protein